MSPLRVELDLVRHTDLEEFDSEPDPDAFELQLELFLQESLYSNTPTRLVVALTLQRCGFSVGESLLLNHRRRYQTRYAA